MIMLGSSTNAELIPTTLERSSGKQNKSLQEVGFTKPIIIQQILDSDITPSKEEYNRLKDLDDTQNVSKTSSNIAKGSTSAAEILNRQFL